ncbi:SGNH/GDSL hydrolase family protein [Oleiharenicola lentus]|uniref:SGNH/GDSL hydrolase family protein n=1 Tax=Oleiharenicola lentus TaxID=2508720 RepID=A0A4Q1C9N2_9BACT|nr:SGNH/GDSL hydrolase family protein [Oleiharenicola lentus]RXK55723.1 SGNH/GDSL hydrolase family protein [Oleiharenicola lentus]
MPESPRLKLLPRLLLSGGAIALTCLSLEIGIRVVDAKAGRGFFSSHRNLLLEATPLLPFRTFGFDQYQEVGGQRYISGRRGELYSFKKPPGVFRIVCFGGSTTEQRSDEGVQYPLRLQQLLRERLGRDNIEVINLGFSAYATPHFLIQLELDVLSWEPDLLILSENINDLTASYFENFTPDYSNKYRHPFYSVPDYRSRFTRANVLFQDVQLYWITRAFVESRLFPPSRIDIRRASLGDQPLPEAQQVFERNLRSFVALARTNGIGVVLASQPLEPGRDFFDQQMAYKPYANITLYPLHEEFLKHHLSYNRTIEKVARETGGWFLDNNSEFGGDRKYFIDMVHYSSAGIDRLAENYANFILSQKIVR